MWEDCSRFYAAFVKKARTSGWTRGDEEGKVLESRGRKRDVGMGPGFFEPVRDFDGVGILSLNLQALEQSKQSPPIFRIPFQVGPVLGFSLRRTTGEQQDGAEVMANGKRPMRRFSALQRVLDLRRLSQRLDGLIVAAALSSDLTGQQALGDFQKVALELVLLVLASSELFCERQQRLPLTLRAR